MGFVARMMLCELLVVLMALPPSVLAQAPSRPNVRRADEDGGAKGVVKDAGDASPSGSSGISKGGGALGIAKTKPDFPALTRASAVDRIVKGMADRHPGSAMLGVLMHSLTRAADGSLKDSPIDKATKKLVAKAKLSQADLQRLAERWKKVPVKLRDAAVAPEFHGLAPAAEISVSQFRKAMQRDAIQTIGKQNGGIVFVPKGAEDLFGAKRQKAAGTSAAANPMAGITKDDPTAGMTSSNPAAGLKKTGNPTAGMKKSAALPTKPTIDYDAIKPTEDPSISTILDASGKPASVEGSKHPTLLSGKLATLKGTGFGFAAADVEVWVSREAIYGDVPSPAFLAAIKPKKVMLNEVTFEVPDSPPGPEIFDIAVRRRFTANAHGKKLIFPNIVESNTVQARLKSISAQKSEKAPQIDLYGDCKSTVGAVSVYPAKFYPGGAVEVSGVIPDGDVGSWAYFRRRNSEPDDPNNTSVEGKWQKTNGQNVGRFTIPSWMLPGAYEVTLMGASGFDCDGAPAGYASAPTSLEVLPHQYKIEIVEGLCVDDCPGGGNDEIKLRTLVSTDQKKGSWATLEETDVADNSKWDSIQPSPKIFPGSGSFGAVKLGVAGGFIMFESDNEEWDDIQKAIKDIAEAIEEFQDSLFGESGLAASVAALASGNTAGIIVAVVVIVVEAIAILINGIAAADEPDFIDTNGFGITAVELFVTDGAHHVGRRDDAIEIHESFVHLRNHVVASGEVSAGLAGLTLLVALGEHEHTHRLTGAVREDQRSADHLVSVLGIDSQADGEVHRLVELGELRALHERARLFDRVFARAVDCFFGLLAVLGQLRQLASLSAFDEPPTGTAGAAVVREVVRETSEPFARRKDWGVARQPSEEGVSSGDDVDTHRARGALHGADRRLDVGAVHVLHLLRGELAEPASR